MENDKEETQRAGGPCCGVRSWPGAAHLARPRAEGAQGAGRHADQQTTLSPQWKVLPPSPLLRGAGMAGKLRQGQDAC